jgi:hypothetical protein
MMQKRAAEEKKWKKREDRRAGAEAKTFAFMAVSGLAGGLGSAATLQEISSNDEITMEQTSDMYPSEAEDVSSEEIAKHIADPDDRLTINPFANLDLDLS